MRVSGRQFTDEEIRTVLNEKTRDVRDRFKTAADRERYWSMREELRQEKQEALEELLDDESYISYRNSQLERVMNTGAVIKEIASWGDFDFQERYQIAASAILRKMDRVALEGKEHLEDFPNNYWMAVAGSGIKVELRKEWRRGDHEVTFSDLDGSEEDPDGEDYSPIEEAFATYDADNSITAKIEFDEIAQRLNGEEREVLSLMYQDYKKVEIAGELGISVKKVDRIREKIKEVAEEVLFGVTESGQLFLWDPLEAC